MRIDTDFLPRLDARCAVCCQPYVTGGSAGTIGSWCPDGDCPGWLIPIYDAAHKPSRMEYYGKLRVEQLLDAQLIPNWDARDIHADRLAFLHANVARAHEYGTNFNSSATYVMTQDLAALVAEVERARGIR